MNYKINVAKRTGNDSSTSPYAYFFATEEIPVSNRPKLLSLLEAFKVKFPDPEFRITVITLDKDAIVESRFMNEFLIDKVLRSYEVRIGNWVNDNNQDVQITSSDIVELDSGERDNFNLIPILLTGSWLLRFGFLTKTNRFYTDAFTITILKTEFYLRPASPVGFYWGYYIENDQTYIHDCEMNDAKPIRFVHELQNLIFAMTFTELELI
jgi:hypothetical protein